LTIGNRSTPAIIKSLDVTRGNGEELTTSILFLILKILGWIILIILGWFIFVQTIIRLVKHFVHSPAPAFAVYLLNNPIRRKLHPPKRVLDYVDIGEGMKVLEVGPGTGFYTFEAAQCAGLSGHVYAIDIEPKMIARLRKKIERGRAENITAEAASAYEIPLPSQSIDRAFMVSVLGEIPDKQKALSEIRRVLKGEGLLTVAEFLFDPDYPRRKTVIGWCTNTGFELMGSYSNTLLYVLTFKLVGQQDDS